MQYCITSLCVSISIFLELIVASGRVEEAGCRSGEMHLVFTSEHDIVTFLSLNCVLLTCLAHWPQSGCSRRRSAGTRRRSARGHSSKSGLPWTSCSRVWSYCDAKSSGNMIQALQNETASRHIKISYYANALCMHSALHRNQSRW